VTDPKLDTGEGARIALDGSEADLTEILLDDTSRHVQAGGVAALYPAVA
jgi:hypothetical protein